MVTKILISQQKLLFNYETHLQYKLTETTTLIISDGNWQFNFPEGKKFNS